MRGAPARDYEERTYESREQREPRRGAPREYRNDNRDEEVPRISEGERRVRGGQRGGPAMRARDDFHLNKLPESGYRDRPDHYEN